MALIINYNDLNNPKNVLAIFNDEPFKYEGSTGFLALYDKDAATLAAYNAALLLLGIDIKYLKVFNSALTEMTQAEKDAVDAAAAAAFDANLRSTSKSRYDGLNVDSLVLKSLADIARQEINNLRQWLVSFKAQVAAAISLADLKIRVATLPDMPDRTLDQLKTAIKSSIDGKILDGQ